MPVDHHSVMAYGQGAEGNCGLRLDDLNYGGLVYISLPMSNAWAVEVVRVGCKLRVKISMARTESSRSILSSGCLNGVLISLAP